MSIRNVCTNRSALSIKNPQQSSLMSLQIQIQTNTAKDKLRKIDKCPWNADFYSKKYPPLKLSYFLIWL